jgi:E3 Ubiquitin ligase
MALVTGPALPHALPLLTVAVISGAAAFDRWRRGRWLEDTPVSRIRSAAQGYVELAGRARLLPGEPILAPLTRRPCVWWRYEIEARQTVGSRREWQVVERGTSDSIFALEDDTGQVIIDPRGAEVSVPLRDVWEGDTPRPSPGPPHRGGSMFLAANYRYTEHLLLADQPLCAVGELRTRRAADDLPTIDADVAAKLHAWKQDAARMASFDRDHDGQISPLEWEAARAAARAEVLRERTTQEAQPGITMLSRPDGHRPFLIGAASRAALTARYRWTARLFALAACGALTWGLYLLAPGL